MAGARALRLAHLPSFSPPLLLLLLLACWPSHPQGRQLLHGPLGSRRLRSALHQQLIRMPWERHPYEGLPAHDLDALLKQQGSAAKRVSLVLFTSAWKGLLMNYLFSLYHYGRIGPDEHIVAVVDDDSLQARARGAAALLPCTLLLRIQRCCCCITLPVWQACSAA